MVVQRVLEGQKYPTLSFVPFLMGKCRNGLLSVVQNSNSPEVRDLADRLLNHPKKGFNTHWGTGIDGTVFTENATLGYRKRQKGLPVPTLLAALIDPRMKGMNLIGPEDVDRVKGEMKSRMRALVKIASANDVEVVPAPVVAIRQKNALHDLFEEIGKFNELLPDQPDEDMDDESLTNFVNTEFNAYMKMPLLTFLEADNETYTCPLKWWKKHQVLFPTLCILAKRLLCIPATSAPSERVFSAAGLTIANDRASLLPQHASEMIFLKKSWDIALEYDRKRNKNRI